MVEDRLIMSAAKYCLPILAKTDSLYCIVSVIAEHLVNVCMAHMRIVWYSVMHNVDTAVF